MKKYLLILIVAIFCLPSEGFAQFHLSTYEWEAKMQNKINTIEKNIIFVYLSIRSENISKS